MIHVTCRLTVKHGDQLRNPRHTLGNRVRGYFLCASQQVRPARRGPPTQHCSARVLFTRTLSATDSLSISLVIQYISSRIHTYIPTTNYPVWSVPSQKHREQYSWSSRPLTRGFQAFGALCWLLWHLNSVSRSDSTQQSGGSQQKGAGSQFVRYRIRY